MEFIEKIEAAMQNKQLYRYIPEELPYEESEVVAIANELSEWIDKNASALGFVSLNRTVEYRRHKDGFGIELEDWDLYVAFAEAGDAAKFKLSHDVVTG